MQDCSLESKFKISIPNTGSKKLILTSGNSPSTGPDSSSDQRSSPRQAYGLDKFVELYGSSKTDHSDIVCDNSAIDSGSKQFMLFHVINS